ncbi:MAG: protein-glutamate methylesterase/protein-glutamine glutaminase [Phenylobacterium sp.]
MVVDDSAVVRGLISRQLASEPSIEVVCTAANGQIALDELRRRTVDVVVLDIEMPVMDGLAALGHMVAEFPQVRVVMASTLTRRNAEISLRALQIGAADYVAKPETGLAAADEFKRELIQKIRALSHKRHPSTPVQPHAQGQAQTPPAATRTRPHVGPTIRPQILAIGASTGGPPALLKLFESLRGAVEQPILLTQHMPPTFTALLAEQLARAGDRPCAEGRDGEQVQPGRCYVAPGGFHMVVALSGTTKVIRLNQEAPENFCRPAVDPMLRSVATAYGAAAAAVILTGMGADGARGCEVLAAAGGRFVAQDETTSVVWGMPGAAAATGMAECILPLDQIGPWARRITGVAA